MSNIYASFIANMRFNQETLRKKFQPELRPFLYCSNPFFQSLVFINQVNSQVSNYSDNIVVISSPKDIEALNPSPMRCKKHLLLLTIIDKLGDEGDGL